MSKEKQIEEMIEAIKKCSCVYTDCEQKCSQCSNEELYDDTINHIARTIYEAGYRKQSENVIELPCKVGTTLYFLYNSPYADKPDLIPRIYKTTDWYFEIDKTGIVINTSDIHSFNKKYDYYLGETVFLTKQGAEQALAKMKGGAG